jgi:hypothetical protein
MDMKDNLRFPSPSALLDVRIATSREELTSAFELVYRSYLAKGYAQPHPGGLIYREAFGLPSSRTIITAVQPKPVVGTLTIVGDNPSGLELERTYPREVQSLRDQGRKVAEITCLAIQAARELRSTAVFFALTRFMIHYAYWRGFDDLLIAVHPRHHRYYWRHFRVSPIGPCRPHECVNGSPSICCRIDLHHLRRNVDPHLWQQYFSLEFPETAYIRPPIAPALHRYLSRRAGLLPHVDSDDGREADKDAA